MHIVHLHSRRHRDKHTSVLSQNVVVQIQAVQTVLLDSNIEMLDHNHPEIFHLINNSEFDYLSFWIFHL